jgi:hypothetical protein
MSLFTELLFDLVSDYTITTLDVPVSIDCAFSFFVFVPVLGRFVGLCGMIILGSALSLFLHVLSTHESCKYVQTKARKVPGCILRPRCQSPK